MTFCTDDIFRKRPAESELMYFDLSILRIFL